MAEAKSWPSGGSRDEGGPTIVGRSHPQRRKQVLNPSLDFVVEIPFLANFNGEKSKISNSWIRFANTFDMVPDCFSVSLFSTFMYYGIDLIIRKGDWCMREKKSSYSSL